MVIISYKRLPVNKFCGVGAFHAGTECPCQGPAAPHTAPSYNVKANNVSTGNMVHIEYTEILLWAHIKLS